MEGIYPLTLGNPSTSPTPFPDDPNDIVTDWNHVLWWVAVPIALAITPVIIVATLVVVIYQWFISGNDLQTMVSTNLVLHELRTSKTWLSRKRDEIIIHPNLHDVYQAAQTAYLLDPSREEHYRRVGDTPDTRFVNVRTRDDVVLDGVMLRPVKHQQRPPASQKWIIYFSGARGTYETNYNSMFEMSRSTGCNLLSINYRGIGRSEGLCKSSNDIKLDAAACIEGLLEQGVRIENILLYGHSLGGGVASATARDFPDVNIVIDRSFESFYAAVRAFIWIPFYRDLVAWIVSFWWDLNSYENLSHVRGRKWLIVAHQDFIIAYKDASLHSAFVRNHVEPPPSLHMRYEINPLASCINRVNDLAMTHIYDLPSQQFNTLTSDFITQ